MRLVPAIIVLTLSTVGDLSVAVAQTDPWGAIRKTRRTKLSAVFGSYDMSHGAPIEAVAWSPDGTRLISAGQDRALKLWSAESGQLLATLEGHEGDVIC